MYSLELGYTTRASIIKINKGTKGGKIDLKIRGVGQGTENKLVNRILRGRPRKLPMIPKPATVEPYVKIPYFNPPEDILIFKEGEDREII